MARNKKTQLTLNCPDDFTPEQRDELAQKVMSAISDRTKKGYNVFGRDWAGKAGQYTDQYAKRKGVSAGGPVDLALSHDMLDAMEHLESRRGKITIGYEEGTQIERKAEGNIIGSYGRRPNPSKARPFLDILQKDLKRLIDEVKE